MRKPKPPDVRVVLRPAEVRRAVFRAGGPGGQHQNKTESAVRYTHVPTGVSAEARSERSQHANAAQAWRLLEQKLAMLWLLSRGRSAAAAWKSKPDASFGSQVRSYVCDGKHRRVLDHRTGHEEPGVAAVLAGGLDGLMRAELWRRAREAWVEEDATGVA